MVLTVGTRDEGVVTTAFDGLLEDLASKQKRLCMVEVMLRRIEAPLKGIQQELRSSRTLFASTFVQKLLMKRSRGY